MTHKKNNTKKKKKNPKAQKGKLNRNTNQISSYKNPLVRASIKFFIFSMLIFGGLYYSDYKGYFDSEKRLDYISKAWDSFDHFTEKNNVDIILLGNSHMFANINPKNLSMTLGANAFALGGPGSAQHDLYFCLKEALKKCKPSLVVLETFSMNNAPLHQDIPHELTHQLNSFSGRNDIITKIISTPILFSADQFGYAWSKTIRNHNYIFSNTKQLKANKKLIEQGNNKQKKNQKLYLGQLIYYTKGMQDTTVAKFNSIKAPVDGGEYTYNKYTEKYTDKIIELCENNGIEIMFFTNPMYEKNIKDYHKWKSKLSKLLNKYNKKWLDLQQNYSSEDFPPICFQNSYNHPNQHLTHLGALVATYKLADFIKANYISLLPLRQTDIEWHKLFYGQDGYFENFSPVKQDKNNKVLPIHPDIKSNFLKEVIISTQKNNKGQEFLKVIAKLERNQIKAKPNSMDVMMVLAYVENGVEKYANLVLKYDIFHKPSDYIIYSQNIKSIDVRGVKYFAFINKQ